MIERIKKNGQKSFKYLCVAPIFAEIKRHEAKLPKTIKDKGSFIFVFVKKYKPKIARTKVNINVELNGEKYSLCSTEYNGALRTNKFNT